jgi:hypothetical protein
MRRRLRQWWRAAIAVAAITSPHAAAADQVHEVQIVATRYAFEPFPFVGAIAAIAQLENQEKSVGRGPRAYAGRYATSLADSRNFQLLDERDRPDTTRHLECVLPDRRPLDGSNAGAMGHAGDVGSGVQRTQRVLAGHSAEDAPRLSIKP